MAITFDAIGVGATGLSASGTSAHTIAGNAILAFVNQYGPSSGRGTVTCAVGGQSMTLLDNISYLHGDGSYSHFAVYGKLNPLTGTRNVVVTMSDTWYTTMNSVSYNGVGSFGTAAHNNGTGTTASLSVTAAADQLVAQGFSGYATTFSAYNKSSRWNQTFVVATNLAMVIGDGAGANPSFSATTANEWGGIGVPMLPSTSTNFFALF